MSKGTHFIGQPLFGQLISLLDKSKILKFSREKDGERELPAQILLWGEFKIQIWVTLIANLLIMILQKRIKRPWSFSGLATMVRIMLMHYVNCYTFFEEPEKDWLAILESNKSPPPEPMLFD